MLLIILVVAIQDYYQRGVPSYYVGEMRIRLPISITDRSQITNLPVDIQILKGRTTWRNPPSIFLILNDFDHLPRFFFGLRNPGYH